MSPKAKFVPGEIEIEIPETAIACPHCESKSHFTDTGKSIFLFEKGVWSILLCDKCREPILAIYKWTGTYAVSPPDTGTPQLEAEPIKVYPRIVPDIHPSIPKEVGEDYKESLMCFAIEAWKATVVLCRRALQNSVVEKGANAGKHLYDQIDELATGQTITKDIKDWAHRIRHLGNDGAHPYDKGALTKVTRDDADQILKFMESYLKYVYEMPYELAKKRR